jgi:hypothetical protein
VSAADSQRLGFTRRQLLRSAAAAAVAWRAAPWPVHPPAAFAQFPPGDPLIVRTLEAFADTLIPGEKRSAADRAIAGVVTGPGAVQAGAIDMMNFPPAGVSAVLAPLAAGLNARATAYAVLNAIVLDPTVAPLVSLDFAQRTDVLVELLDGASPDQLAYFALAGLVFLAYHTAGHRNLPEAVRAGHPGLAAIGFPQPDPDDLWRFPAFSYRRVLAVRHPRSRRGNPA